jgi:hypothetical protein
MAFGRMVTKFRIISGKINGSLKRVAKILMACARLHNFIIQRDGSQHLKSEEEAMLQITPNPAAPLGISYLPSLPDKQYVFMKWSMVSRTQERRRWNGWGMRASADLITILYVRWRRKVAGCSRSG